MATENTDLERRVLAHERISASAHPATCRKRYLISLIA